MPEKLPRMISGTGNLEAEIGHIALNAELKGEINEWLARCDGNIEKCLVIWLQRDTGTLHMFGTNMKCVEGIGYLEVAKSELLEIMYSDDEEDDDDEDTE